MRILLIHNYYREWGGEDTYFKNLQKLLTQKGHIVSVFTKKSRNINSFIDKAAVAIGMFYNPKVCRDLDRKIKSFKPDIIQAQNVYPLISPSIYRICEKNGIPVIQRLSSYRYLCPGGYLFNRGAICQLCVTKKLSYPSIIYGCYHRSRLSSLFFSFSFFYHKYILRSFEPINTYLFPSLFIRDYFIGKKAIPMEKTKVIATFAEHYPTLRNDQKFRDYYIFAGQLVEEKGIYQLLDLFSRDGRLKLVVVGRYTKQLFDKYRNCRNIEFVGFCSREKTLSLMTSAAATIMPSLWYDVMPNVLIESFSVGTPVIAPKIGVFPELIGRGLGKIYPYGSSIALKKILLDYKKTAQIQTAVKKEYYSRYLPMHHYRQLISLYEKLL